MANLTSEHIKRIKSTLKDGTFNELLELFKIVSLGIQEEEAKMLLNNVIKEYKEELYYDVKDKNEIEENENLAFGLLIMASLLVSIFAASNVFFIFLLAIFGIVIGYWGYSKHPIAGAIGCFVAATLTPFAVNFYLAGRSSFFNLELLIPIAFSFGPGFLLKYILVKFVFEEDEI
jgi:hypothetical protein